jgi:hypothetical protein
MGPTAYYQAIVVTAMGDQGYRTNGYCNQPFSGMP